jgi:guanylate kinase
VFIVVVGPSGVGKKIDRRWMEHQYPTIFKHVPSYTTRQPRPYEHQGIDYIYITLDQYNQKIKEGQLLENAQFGLTHYGLGGDLVLKYLSLGY